MPSAGTAASTCICQRHGLPSCSAPVVQLRHTSRPSRAASVPSATSAATVCAMIVPHSGVAAACTASAGYQLCCRDAAFHRLSSIKSSACQGRAWGPGQLEAAAAAAAADSLICIELKASQGVSNLGSEEGRLRLARELEEAQVEGRVEHALPAGGGSTLSLVCIHHAEG